LENKTKERYLLCNIIHFSFKIYILFILSVIFILFYFILLLEFKGVRHHAYDNIPILTNPDKLEYHLDDV